MAPARNRGKTTNSKYVSKDIALLLTKMSIITESVPQSTQAWTMDRCVYQLSTVLQALEESVGHLAGASFNAVTILHLLDVAYPPVAAT